MTDIFENGKFCLCSSCAIEKIVVTLLGKFFWGEGNKLGGKSPSTGRRRLGSPEEAEVPEGGGGSGEEGGSPEETELPEGDRVAGRGQSCREGGAGRR